ncbi:hypothetical protein J4474_00260 [Candidatus Pacearchaeota archaeon]|nr:hypothetical protein [Candidatus Pacearchaeota archaeon]
MTNEKSPKEKDEKIILLEKDLLKFQGRTEFERKRFGEYLQMYQNCAKDLHWIINNKCEGNNPFENYGQIEIGIALLWKAYERVRKEAEEKFV